VKLVVKVKAKLILHQQNHRQKKEWIINDINILKPSSILKK
jgi:hypothetical protein